MSTFLAALPIVILYCLCFAPIEIAKYRNHNKKYWIHCSSIGILLLGTAATLISDSVLIGCSIGIAYGLVITAWALFGSDVEDKTLPYVPEPSPGLDDAPRVMPEPLPARRTEAKGTLVSISVLKGSNPPFEASIQDVFFEDSDRADEFAKANEQFLIGKTKVYIGE